MELRTYIKILMKRWWAVLTGFLVVAVATWLWTIRQEPIYRSEATFVLRPHSAAAEDDIVRTIEMVSRRVEINTTFAEVASSKLFKRRARLAAGISSSDLENYSVSASVIGGTNIMRITTEGTDPELVQDYATQIGNATVEYVRELYDVFELHPLDSASLPSRPVRPSLFLNLTVGSLIGLTLGVGLAFLVEIVRSPFGAPDTFNIVDHTTGAYNRSYFTLRLWQEMNRSNRHEYPLSLGLIRVEIDGENISAQDRVEVMRVFKRVMESQIRSDDILAWINGDTFAVLCAYMPSDKAKEFVDRLKSKFGSVVSDVLSKNGAVRVKNYSSVVTFNGGAINEAAFLEKGVQELEASSAKLASEA